MKQSLCYYVSKIQEGSQTQHLHQLFPSPCWSDLVNAFCQEVYFLLEQEKVWYYVS